MPFILGDDDPDDESCKQWVDSLRQQTFESTNDEACVGTDETSKYGTTCADLATNLSWCNDEAGKVYTEDMLWPSFDNNHDACPAVCRASCNGSTGADDSSPASPPSWAYASPIMSSTIHVQRYESNNECNDWAVHGECATNREYMLANCCSACRSALRSFLFFSFLTLG